MLLLIGGEDSGCLSKAKHVESWILICFYRGFIAVGNIGNRPPKYPIVGLRRCKCTKTEKKGPNNILESMRQGKLQGKLQGMTLNGKGVFI
jgi:hypothetical protein